MVIGTQDGDVKIPSGWDLKPLGECVKEKLSYGINAPAIPYDGKHPAYIRITDITEDGRYDDSDRKAVPTQELERYTLCEGDIVLARTGASTGKSYLYDKKDGQLVYAGFLIKASVDCEANNARFIVGQLRTPRYWAWVAATSMRSGQPGINGKEYSSFLVPTAPKKEQDAIAETLSTFDDHIANLAELIEKKKAIRDGTLEDLMSGRTRLTGFSDGWITVPIGDILDFRNGLNKGKEYFGHGTPIVNYMDVYHHSGLFASDIKGTVSLSRDEIKHFAVRKNDVFFTRTSETPEEVGLSAVLLEEIPDCVFSGFVLRGRPKNDILISEYCKYCFSAKEVREKIISNCTYTTRALTNGRALSEIEILVPPKAEQKAIADVLTAMDDEIKALEDERDKMIQIREGAMDDLLTGRVRLAI